MSVHACAHTWAMDAQTRTVLAHACMAHLTCTLNSVCKGGGESAGQAWSAEQFGHARGHVQPGSNVHARSKHGEFSRSDRVHAPSGHMQAGGRRHARVQPRQGGALPCRWVHQPPHRCVHVCGCACTWCAPLLWPCSLARAHATQDCEADVLPGACVVVPCMPPGNQWLLLPPTPIVCARLEILALWNLMKLQLKKP